MLQRLQRIARRPLLLWLALWALTAILYLPAWKGGFQQDFEGWLYYYRTLPFSDLMNRKGAGIFSFYQVTQFQLYILTKLFDVRPMLWFGLFTALHALNGVQLCRLGCGLMEDFGLHGAVNRDAERIAIAGTLLALFNPAMTEVVEWKACYHYLVGVQAILWSLIWARDYLRTGRAAYAWRSILLFIPLSFTLEIWYTIPVLTLLLALAYGRAELADAGRVRAALLRIFLPQAALLGGHLLAYRAVAGTWMAHNAYTTPGSDSLLSVMGRIWSNEFHLFGLGRFFSNDVRQFFYEHIGGKAGGALALGFIIALAAIGWLRFPRMGARGRVALLFAGFSIISLGIVLHFEPPRTMLVFNDRYLYFTAFFQSMLAAIGISWIWARFPRNGYAFYALMLALMVAATEVLVLQWRHSAKAFWAVQDKFRWQDAPAVLLLNLPATYNGVGIIQSQVPSEFPDHLFVFHKPLPRGKVYDVAGYNMQHAWDGAHVKVDDSAHLTITLNQWGAWWWRGGFGAVDYENDTFAVRFTDPGHYYQLTLKKPLPPGSVLLFQQGLEWRAVDMRKVGVEQW